MDTGIWTHTGQREPRGAQSGQFGPKWPKMAQNGTFWPFLGFLAGGGQIRTPDLAISSCSIRGRGSERSGGLRGPKTPDLGGFGPRAYTVINRAFWGFLGAKPPYRHFASGDQTGFWTGFGGLFGRVLGSFLGV